MLESAEAAMGRDEIVERLVRLGGVDAVDVMLGEKIQKGGGLLGLFVSRAFRHGHMAVRVGDEIVPSVLSVFSDDGTAVVDAELEGCIVGWLRREMGKRSGQLIFDGDVVALPYAYGLEEALAREVRRISEADPFVKADGGTVDELVNEGQRAAIMAGMDTSLCCVTGGPGTGKTYTAGVFLRVLARACRVRPLRVAAVAPTGRAVQALASSMARMGGEAVAVDARTIHSLVGQRGGAFLPYHVVIVDEGSMIGSALMLKMLERCACGTRVLILGDADQLPSIDPGQPFFELLKAKSVPRASLTGCQRTASASLLALAEGIRSGESQSFDRVVGGDVSFVDCQCDGDWKRAEADIEREVLSVWRSEMSLDAARLQVRTTALLTPSRKGYWGADRLNEHMGWQKVYTPVVCTKNSHHLGVMNGDIGVLERKEPYDHVHFQHGTIPSVLVPRMERSFAMTVHKSQGGEFDRVVLVIPPGALVDRRLLYTASTRAKKRLTIIGRKEDVTRAIEHKGERLSLLAHKLCTQP